MRVLGLAVTLAAGLATPAGACTAFLPPSERISMAYGRDSLTSAALVRITTAEPLPRPVADAQPWQAHFAVDRLLFGSQAAADTRFERGFGSATCDEGYPLPKPGQQWVVYFGKGSDGRPAIWLTYPADVAFASDPRLPKDAR